MSIRFVSCKVKQDSKEVAYSSGGHVQTVLLGPKRIELHLETDGLFPSTYDDDTFDGWFATKVVPLLDPESLRLLIREATIHLLAHK